MLFVFSSWATRNWRFITCEQKATFKVNIEAAIPVKRTYKRLLSLVSKLHDLWKEKRAIYKLSIEAAWPVKRKESDL